MRPPAGQLLFLHSNLHKWDMRLPEKFSLHYQRRWQQLEPEGQHWEAWMNEHLGYDLERKVGRGLGVCEASVRPVEGACKGRRG